jgi:hypothetical protein
MAGVKGRSGGPRPNSGPKTKRVKFAGPIARAERQIVGKLPDIVGSLLELADGIRVQGMSPDGDAIVYDKPPDREAAKYLLDRIMGKPTERQEQTGETALTIRVQYADGETYDNADASEAALSSESSVGGSEAV